MEFVPPVFRNLGKPVADLLSRKYKYDKSFKARTKTAEGLAVTGEHSQNGDKNSTKLVARFEDTAFGAFEGQIDTAVNYKGTLKLSQLAKGVVVKTIVEQHPQGSIEVDYTQANLAVTLNAAHAKDNKKDPKKATNKVGAAAVVGFDGLSLGGEVSYNVTESKVADYNAGFQYLTAKRDYELSIKTTNQTDKVSIYGLHKYTKATSVATQVDLDLTAAATGTVTFGASQKFDADTTLQGKIQASKKATIVGGVWERTLGPQTRLTLATEFEANNLTVANPKFGLGLVIGELSLSEL